MALPFLPGYGTSSALGADKHHKPHVFDVRNGVPVFVGAEKSGIGGAVLPGQKSVQKSKVVANGTGQPAPSWVAYDRQVLRFSAFFQEAVHEKREEKYRIRKCTVLYYLEDDSIQVNEAKQENSGIPQGTLIKRHRIPMPPPNDDQFYEVDVLNVGNEVTLYGRAFTITDCDAFTRNYLTKLGVKVPEAPDVEPADPYRDHRTKQAATMQPHRPYEKCDTLKQFLDNDRKVLRFTCVWDNSSEMFGDVRELILHYFLADDTMEIREVIRANSGRDAAPKFLRRSKVPKEVGSLHKPGEICDRTVLNVFGPMGHGGRYILDSLKCGAVDSRFYTDGDLTIGAKINVWGRQVTVCDMDEFTEHHYKSKFSVEKPTPIQYKGLEASKMDREMPPYNGWGSEEDSRANCLKLIAQAPKRDFIKFMKKDRQGLDSHVLRFFARLDSNRPIDTDRTFIISFFLSDDTISVFEPEKRNSGIVHGKFIERNKIMRPDGDSYKAEDLHVGAVVSFRSHQFVITDADEYALKYAENHQFPEASISRIMEIVSDRIPEENINEELKGKTTMNHDEFMMFIESHLGVVLSQHALLVLARRYANPLPSKIGYDLLLNMARDSLQKINCEQDEELLLALSQAESADGDLIQPDDFYRVAIAVGLPLKNELLTALIQKVPKTCGKVNFKKLVLELRTRGIEEEVSFVPASQLTDPDVSANGWYGLPNPNHISGPIETINIEEFKEDLLGLKRTSTTSPAKSKVVFA